MNRSWSDAALSDLRAELLVAGECLADPELHRGPAGVESADERAARIDVAREVCQSCPVAAECLTYALRTRPERGVWAGFTAEQIHQLAALVGVPLDAAVYLLTATSGAFVRQSRCWPADGRFESSGTDGKSKEAA